jgi:hypothetical protein
VWKHLWKRQTVGPGNRRGMRSASGPVFTGRLGTDGDSREHAWRISGAKGRRVKACRALSRTTCKHRVSMSRPFTFSPYQPLYKRHGSGPHIVCSRNSLREHSHDRRSSSRAATGGPSDATGERASQRTEGRLHRYRTWCCRSRRSSQGSGSGRSAIQGHRPPQPPPETPEPPKIELPPDVE